MSLLQLILLVLPCSSAYKMALFVPNMANSQVLFNARVAEALAKAGNDVTMIMITAMEGFDSKDVKIMEQVKIHRVNASFGMTKKEIEEYHSKTIFKDLSIFNAAFRSNIKRMTTFLTSSCREMVKNKEFLEWLKAQEFDLAFSHMYDVCPIGLIHYAEIPSWIWLNSGALMGFVAHSVGVPLIPSYVPALGMASADHMSFMERTKSLIGHAMTPFMWRKMIVDRETAIFRREVDPYFPDIADIAKKCPLVMVNSNELYDLPRPTLAKIVNIGGIGIQHKDAKPLPLELQRIVDAAEGVVVFSFGSVTPSEKMPMDWKHAFIDAFERFPKYHFLWKYVGDDLQGKLPSNVHLFNWLPQVDLLQNPKTKVFLSHGGYNSLQEAISAGVPMITVALYGDQLRNAKLGERHHFSINIEKSKLSADTVANALHKLFSDQSYSNNVRRLSQMVKKKPVSPDHLLVSWAEFAAEFKTLDNLVPAGNKLNFFQYYSLDVIVFLLSIVVLVLYISYRILKFALAKAYCCVCRTRKEKKA